MSLLDRVSRFIDDVLLLPEAIRDRLEAAEDALEVGENEVAEQLFAEVLRERSTLPRAAVGLAQARHARGDLEGTAAALARARELEPDDPDVALFDARVALAQRDAERAAKAARDAAGRLAQEGGARLVEACVLRARAERQRNRPDRAARELRKALSIRRDDVQLRAELVEVLADGRRVIAARAAASGLAPTSLDDAAATRVGLALERIGAGDLAAPWLERAAEAGSDAALIALGRRSLKSGAHEQAETLARRAISRGAGGEALALLADVLLVEGRDGDAAEAFAAASKALGGDAELLRRAARVAPVDGAEALTAHADNLERQSPGEAAARAARAHAAVTSGDLDKARALTAEDAPELRLHLARARLSLAEDRPREALDHLNAHAAHKPSLGHGAVDEALVAALGRAALRALWLGPNGEVDLAAAIDGVEAFARRHDLVEASRAAARLRDELDRPLLLAILGEFNAGKSTFINAFVGADVAPTGIVPTTATLNVLRGGAERRVRVVKADGTTREGAYDELKGLLADAEGEGVDQVEIVLPSDTLERVWILDTPGTNAIDPAHERLAREAARRADAAIWIFSAGQAGKETEAKMLAAIRESGRAVVPVLNKVDRLSTEQLAQVEATLETELGGLGRPIAVSAKRALKARLAGDDDAFAESGYGRLLEALEEQVFARSRELKRGACAGRLVEILDGALETEKALLSDHEQKLGLLRAAESRLGELDTSLERAVDEAVRHLSKDLEVAFKQAGEEVVSFVRPRKNRFTRHGADPEDRAFLAEALERRLGSAADGVVARLVPRVRGVLAEPVEGLGLDAMALDRRVRAAVAGPLALYVGYQRGVLRGGGLRRFFEDYLPSADLEVGTLAEALAVARVDPGAELRPGLADALRDLLGALADELAREVEAVRIARETTADTVFAPLRALREVLAELAPGVHGDGPAIA